LKALKNGYVKFVNTKKDKRPLNRENTCPRWDSNCIPALANTGLPGNMRNPAGSDPHTTQSDAQIVHTVHTPKVAFQRTPKENRVPIRGNAVHLFVATSRTTSGCTSS
jgi:hypothetical protein